MSQRRTPSQIDLESLLEHGRSSERLPESVRARALARAHAFVASPPIHALESITPRIESITPRTGLSLVRGFAAALAVAGVAALAAAFTLRGPSTHRIAAPPAPSASAPGCPAILPSAQASPGFTAAPESSVFAPPTPPKLQRRDRTNGTRESVPTELELLQRAHTAYSAQDFGTALALVSEQARRFPNGTLAEEREALRVRSLAGAGREAEARRAATGFTDHFPRSVLLPQIQQFKTGNH
ncbi:MAG: hypothetical protein ABIQ16_04940 [Polyangiaceae bacterium]